MEIDLVCSEVVEAYVASVHAPKRRRRPNLVRHPVTLPVGPARSSKGTRCHCGQCSCCKENARWERIFNEKFADPEYYRPQPATMGSSLNSWL
jgi:hypothetical protein